LERERGLGIRPQGEYTIDLNQITYHAIELIETIRSDGGFREPEPADIGSFEAAKIKILFVAASPDDAAKLHLDVEVRQIEEVLRAATQRERYEFHKIAAVRPNDLLAAMNRIRPHFFHFSGHGNGGAIHLLDDDNQARAVSKTHLGDLFKLYRKDIACVFLNACYGAQQAEAISQHIPKVIGTRAAIPDSVAIQYATLFYQAIGEGGDIEYAFEYAKMSVGMNGMMGGEELVMISGGGGNS